MIENALTIGSILKGATTYTIEKQLHQGGFGMTYLAKARIMVGNIPQVAMFSIKEFFIGKICSRDANGNVLVAQENQQLFKQAKQDFREEAEILHSLKHANIVPVNEVFEQNNTVYYVMAYLGNVSLYQYVSEQGGALSENQAREIVSALSGALSYLHNRHILHLDVKPDNVMMMGDGASAKPVLIDFGQAVYFENGKPKRNKGIGGYSRGFSPLELKQTVAEFQPSLDIYSLAATLLYMLTGKEPCDASEQSVHKIYRALPEDVSQNTMDAIICGMQKDSLCHPQTILDFQNILQMGKTQIGGGSDTGTGGPIVTDPVISHSSSSLPVGKVASIAVGLLLVGMIGWYSVKNFGGKGTSADVAPQEEKNDTASKDTVKISKFTAQPAAETPKADNPQVSDNPSKPEKVVKHDDSNGGQASVNPVKRETPTSGTVNLGYATWTGGLLNGKPHGNGRMKFRSSHAIGGCSTVPEAGDYIDGYCENGVVQSGALYRNGEKIETIIR